MAQYDPKGNDGKNVNTNGGPTDGGDVNIQLGKRLNKNGQYVGLDAYLPEHSGDEIAYSITLRCYQLIRNEGLSKLKYWFKRSGYKKGIRNSDYDYKMMDEYDTDINGSNDRMKDEEQSDEDVVGIQRKYKNNSGDKPSPGDIRKNKDGDIKKDGRGKGKGGGAKIIGSSVKTLQRLLGIYNIADNHKNDDEDDDSDEKITDSRLTINEENVSGLIERDGGGYGLIHPWQNVLGREMGLKPVEYYCGAIKIRLLMSPNSSYVREGAKTTRDAMVERVFEMAGVLDGDLRILFNNMPEILDKVNSGIISFNNYPRADIWYCNDKILMDSIVNDLIKKLISYVV